MLIRHNRRYTMTTSGSLCRSGMFHPRSSRSYTIHKQEGLPLGAGLK